MAETREYQALKEAYMASQANATVKPSPVSNPDELSIPPFSGEDLQLLKGEELILPTLEDLPTSFFSKTFGQRPAYYMLCSKKRGDGSVIPFELWLASLSRKIYHLREGKLPQDTALQKTMNCGGGLIIISANMAANEYKPYKAFAAIAGKKFPVVENFRIETYGRDNEGRIDYNKTTFKLLYQLGRDASEAAYQEIPSATATEASIAAMKKTLSPASAASAGAKGGKAGKKS